MLSVMIFSILLVNLETPIYTAKLMGKGSANKLVDRILGYSDLEYKQMYNSYYNNGNYAKAMYFELIRDKKYNQLNLVEFGNAVFGRKSKTYKSPITAEQESEILNQYQQTGFIGVFENMNKVDGLKQILQSTAHKIHEANPDRSIYDAYKTANEQIFGKYMIFDSKPLNLILPKKMMDEYGLGTDQVRAWIPMFVREIAQSGEKITFVPYDTMQSKDNTDYYEEIDTWIQEKKIGVTLKSARGKTRFQLITDPEGKGWNAGIIHIDPYGNTKVLGTLFADNKVIHKHWEEIVKGMVEVVIYNYLKRLDANHDYTWEDIEKMKIVDKTPNSIFKDFIDLMGWKNEYSAPSKIEYNLVILPLIKKYRNSGLTVQQAAREEIKNFQTGRQLMK